MWPDRSVHAGAPGVDGAAARYRALVDALPDGVARFALLEDGDRIDLRLIDANAAFRQLTGGSAVVGRRIAELRPPVVPSGAHDLARYAQAVHGGAAHRVESQLVETDQWFACTAYGSAPGELTVICEDVTAYERAARARRRADARLRCALDAGATPMVIVRQRDERIVDANAAYLTLTGVSRDEAIGRTLAELGQLPPGQLASLDAARDPTGVGAPAAVAHEFVARDGGARSVLASRAPLSGDDGAACWLVTLRDVTARRRAERGFAAAFTDNPVPLSISRVADRRVLDVNTRMLALLGMRRDEVVGKTAAELGLVSAAAQRTFFAARDRRLAAEGPRELEVTIRTRAGAVLTLLGDFERVDLDGAPCTVSAYVDISEHKLAEDAFARAFHAGPAGMLLLRGTRLEVVDVNDHMLAMTGYERGEVIGRLAAELALLAPEARGQLAGRRAFGATRAQEVELKTQADARITALASSEDLMIGDDLHRLVLFVDITERKRTERRLATQHACSRALVESATIEAMSTAVLEALCRSEGWDLACLWLADRSDGALRASGSWVQPGPDVAAVNAYLRGLAILPGEGFPGRIVETRDVLETDVDAGSLPCAELALRLGMRHAVGVPITRGDVAMGAVTLLSRHAPALDPALREILASLGRSMALFIERLESEAALNVSKELMRTVVRALHDGLMVADATGRFLRWNPTALQMHGLPPDADIADYGDRLTTMFELADLDGAPLPYPRWPLRRLLAGEELRDCELLVRRPDQGWERVFRFGGSLVRLSDGTPLAALTITDVTERVRATTALRQLTSVLELRVAERTAALEASNRDLEAFSYSVSHDLRAPLRAITGFTAIVLDEHGAGFGPELSRILTNVRDSGQRLTSLIDDLIAFAKLGRAPLRLAEVDVGPFVKKLIDDRIAREPARAIEIAIAALPACRADPALIRQVWTHLIDNALKFTRARAPAVIEISGTRDADTVTYRIRDNGAGFDPQYANRLFGLFQRLHRAQDFEGSGVGLASARRILERHGGKIWATSAPDRGCEVCFALAAGGPA